MGLFNWISKKTKAEEIKAPKADKWIQSVIEKTGWDHATAKARMDEAKEKHDIGYADYFRSGFYDLPEEKKAQAAEKIRQRHKKNQERKEHCIKVTVENTGWTEQKAEKEIRNAKKLTGAKYAEYEKYTLWNYTPEQLPAVWKTIKEGNEASLNMPERPFGTKISSISDEGIEYYWKKLERVSGYEIYRSYDEEGSFELLTRIENRRKGTFKDTSFDHEKKEVFYRMRTFLTDDEGNTHYSAYTEPKAAQFREELEPEREVTYMYSRTSRPFKAFVGWGEAGGAAWSSDNEAVARVSSDGVVEAVAEGECVLTCEDSVSGMQCQTRIVVDRKAPEPLSEITSRYEPDPETGIWKNKDAEVTNEAVITMVGDMMCGQKQMNAQKTETGWDFRDSFEFVRDRFMESDLAVGNLETLLAAGWPYMADEVYINNFNNCNAPATYLDAVKYGGLDAVVLANNHNCDGGPRALKDTIEQVRKYRFASTGAFTSADEKRYFIADVNGIRVGFLAYMSKFTGFNGKEKEWDKADQDTMLNIFTPEKAKKDIEACRAGGAEFVITYMHWGLKNFKTVSDRQKQEAGDAANAGADMIIGSNPHVLQPFEVLTDDTGRKVPCYFSLGNFQSIMNQVPGNRESLIVRIKLRKDESGRVILAENDYLPCNTFTTLEGCHWAPVSLTDTPDADIGEKGRCSIVQNISELIGFESSSVKRMFFRKTADKTGWEKHEAYRNIEYICRGKGVSYADVYMKDLYAQFRSERADELKTYIDSGKELPDIHADIDENEFEAVCYSDSQKKAWEKICSGNVTVDALFDYMQLKLPDSLKDDSENYMGRIKCRPRGLGRNNIQVCLRKGDAQPEIAKKKKTVCVIGLPAFREDFEQAGLEFISCSEAGSYVLDLAAHQRRQHKAKVVGISGSIGKTTTTDMIGDVLRPAMDMYKITGNQNTNWQICEFVYDLEPETDVYVQEASGSFPGQLEKSSYVLAPDVFVLTNIGNGHLENYDGKQQLLLYEKLAFDRHAADGAVGIINWDDPLLKKVPFIHEVKSFAIKDETADFRGVCIKSGDESIEFEVLEKDGTRTPVKLNTIGRHNVMNALAAFAVGVQLGVDRAEIAENLLEYRPEDNRQNLMQLSGQSVYVDIYSATVESMMTAMEVTRDFSVPEGGRKIAVLADVPALGDESEEAHRSIGRMVKEVGGADEVFFYGKEMKAAFEEAKNLGVTCRHTEDRSQLEDWLRNDTSENDFVCFKASHKTFLHIAIDNVYGTAFSEGDEANYFAPKVFRKGIRYKVISDYGAVVTRIGKKRYSLNDSLEIRDEVDGEKVRIIRENAFSGCGASGISLPESLRGICERAFYGCKDLKTVQMPSVQYIGEEAFAGCTSLEEMIIPEGAETICPRAFAGCTNLKNVKIPDSVKTIAEDAFEGTPYAETSESKTAES